MSFRTNHKTLRLWDREGSPIVEFLPRLVIQSQCLIIFHSKTKVNLSMLNSIQEFLQKPLGILGRKDNLCLGH